MQLAANNVTYWYLFSHPESGGYEYEFVDAVADKYHCAICTKVMRNARLVACCGKHFCDSCLRKWIESARQKICPHCREVGFQDVLNKEKIREINEFRIRCTNSDKGCEWVGELGAVKKHLESDSGCGYVEVKCSSQGYDIATRVLCGATMERRHLSNHQENECVYRQYKCQHCGCTDTYDAIAGSGRIMNGCSNITGSGNHYNECAEYPTSAGSENHYNKCAEFPLECPNKCSDNSIRRRDLKTHKDTVCPLEPVKCPYSDYCSLRDIILRRDLESHKKVCDFRPYKCEYCSHNGTYISMSGKGKRWTQAGPHHYDVCEQYPLECTNQCGEEGIKRKDMKTHRDACPLEPLECPFTSHHGFTILRRDMENHKKECDFRPYKCQYCGISSTYISITGGVKQLKQCHYDTCEEYPLDCPNKCTAHDIKRKNMKRHREKCPLELLNCPFNYVGCTSTKQRRNMDQHCQQSTQEHLLLVAQSHHELAQKNKDLVSKNKELVSKIEEVSHKSHEDYQRLSRRVEELTRKNEKMAVRPRQHGVVRYRES